MKTITWTETFCSLEKHYHNKSSLLDCADFNSAARTYAREHEHIHSSTRRHKFVCQHFTGTVHTRVIRIFIRKYDVYFTLKMCFFGTINISTEIKFSVFFAHFSQESCLMLVIWVISCQTRSLLGSFLALKFSSNLV